MNEKEHQIEKIAEMLKNNGLAASMYEAREKARNIVTSSNPNPKAKQEVKEEGQDSGKERFSEQDYDVQKEDVSLNELMKELGIDDENPAKEKNEPEPNDAKPQENPDQKGSESK